MSKNSLNIKIPLEYDPVDGPYKTNKNLIDAINQNIRILFMTNPYERIMNYDFGIGINRFVFENFGYELVEKITETIHSQFNKYIPNISIKSLEVNEINNGINIKLRWAIESYNISSIFEEDFRE